VLELAGVVYVLVSAPVLAFSCINPVELVTVQMLPSWSTATPRPLVPTGEFANTGGVAPYALTPYNSGSVVLVDDRLRYTVSFASVASQ
jgi:hypothetical protein